METFVIIAQQCLVVHRGVYLGSANVQTQYFSSDLQRLCMEDLSYHPKTCLEEKDKKNGQITMQHSQTHRKQT